MFNTSLLSSITVGIGERRSVVVKDDTFFFAHNMSLTSLNHINSKLLESLIKSGRRANAPAA